MCCWCAILLSTCSSSYHYSHPTLLERLDAMKRYQKRGNVKWQ
jgi:Zn-dependent protease with chaperone function